MSITAALQMVRDHLQKAPSIKFHRAQPHILTSELPEHWRSNKSLQIPFTVLSLMPVPDGTKITVHAGNEEAPCGEIRNAQSEFKRQCAKFSDLRFVGKSGRGRQFDLTLVIHTDPLQIAMVGRAIKVTCDGPRPGRPSANTRRSGESHRIPNQRRRRPAPYPPRRARDASSDTSSEASFIEQPPSPPTRSPWDTPPGYLSPYATIPFASPQTAGHPMPLPIPHILPQLYHLQLQYNQHVIEQFIHDHDLELADIGTILATLDAFPVALFPPPIAIYSPTTPSPIYTPSAFESSPKSFSDP